MFNEAKMHEVEKFAQNSRENDMKVGTMATIRGIKGLQFGKEIFTAVLPFKDLMDFLMVFPEVQREVEMARVRSIKRYILDKDNMKFFSAITASARGNIFYSDADASMAVDVNRSKLSLNDGQHRFLGTAAAIKALTEAIEKAQDEEEKQQLIQAKTQLENSVMPIVIFNNLTEEEEKQLFHDLNGLAKRPSRSSNIKLSMNDKIARMATELSIENRYLKHYGVEVDKSSVQANNPNTFLLTTIYELIRRMLWNERNSINNDNYKFFKGRVNTTMDRLFQVLPGDLDKKGKYILDKNYSLKAIGKFIQDSRNSGHTDEAIFEAIGSVNWLNHIDAWKPYNGHTTKGGYLTFGASGGHGIIAVIDALEDKLMNK